MLLKAEALFSLPSTCTSSARKVDIVWKCFWKFHQIYCSWFLLIYNVFVTCFWEHSLSFQTLNLCLFCFWLPLVWTVMSTENNGQGNGCRTSGLFTHASLTVMPQNQDLTCVFTHIPFKSLSCSLRLYLPFLRVWNLLWKVILPIWKGWSSRCLNLQTPALYEMKSNFYKGLNLFRAIIINTLCFTVILPR